MTRSRLNLGGERREVVVQERGLGGEVAKLNRQSSRSRLAVNAAGWRMRTITCIPNVSASHSAESSAIGSS